MKDKGINEAFKKVFKHFLKTKLSSCETLIKGVDNCENYDDLKILLEDNVHDIFKKLGGECKYCEDKDDTIEELVDSVSDLSEERDLIEKELSLSYTPITLDDEYKLEAFKKHKDNFNISEFESLLD